MPPFSSSPPTPRFAPALRRGLAGLAGLLLAQQALAFGFDEVAAQAARLAAKPYAAPADALPAELRNLSYDQLRDIRFKPERALWRQQQLPFELMFFHLGKFQTQAVRINEVSPQGAVRPIAFRQEDFDYGKNRFGAGRQQAWGDLGFAGFRAHYALNNAAYKDELVVFLGASYFRALGAGQHYGLSARGLAIDPTGDPARGSGEEFPRFTEFWIERPAPDAKALTIHALLDSPRASGAYQFVIHPGANSRMDVRARLFLRAPVRTLALAPLTSMYMFGENQPHRSDFRPEVHDSDGLMLATGEGEWIWRPLINPAATLTTSFATRSPKGFGLMQRDRAFANYEDTEARYEQRPSAWVEPVGDWGPGRVELMLLHTPDETNDNVVAYWVPERQPAPGQPLDFAYRLHLQGERQQRPPGAWVTQTRVGRGFAELAPDEQQYVVDFSGPALEALGADAPVEAVLSTDANGHITERNAYRNPVTGAWRMTVRVRQLRPSQPTELRGFLKHKEQALTETWSTILPSR
ncbi:glucan biosynthesis protein G [Roseateles sp. DAIF2]|uniref:glucan biosynthesis protein G n=1 Tax=Roseateles sp. DAIF2 TaxID=2714952 RepID=UPI0018A2DC8C|nr:glucan biosynthesis protein G [Roseateles sp. DAIF2]QPF75803.1 glucan biosynthesis protein G [Roseateles sp. DAIF2]